MPGSLGGIPVQLGHHMTPKIFLGCSMYIFLGASIPPWPTKNSWKGCRLNKGQTRLHPTNAPISIHVWRERWWQHNKTNQQKNNVHNVTTCPSTGAHLISLYQCSTVAPNKYAETLLQITPPKIKWTSWFPKISIGEPSFTPWKWWFPISESPFSGLNFRGCSCWWPPPGMSWVLLPKPWTLKTIGLIFVRKKEIWGNKKWCVLIVKSVGRLISSPFFHLGFFKSIQSILQMTKICNHQQSLGRKTPHQKIPPTVLVWNHDTRSCPTLWYHLPQKPPNSYHNPPWWMCT